MSINIIDAGLQFKDNHSDRSGAPKGIVLHHAAANGSVEQVHSWHLGNGWAGIGYHFYVRKDGSIYRGRPESWLGAHTSGYNDMLGVCAEGNFMTDTMGAAQQSAIVAVLQYLYGKYGRLKVYKHKDLDATGCPGDNYPFTDIVNASNGAAVSAPAATAQAEETTITPEEDRVKLFQEACIADGLPLNVYGADGIWGTETAQAATYTLQSGSAGNRVKLIQRLLIGDCPKYGADGHFGAEMDAAVRKYQSKYGLDVDGIVGLYTWRAVLGVK